MSTTHIILDNGHGADDFTNGKYSQILNQNEFDCESSLVYKYRYREGNGNREIVNRLKYYLATYLNDVKVHDEEEIENQGEPVENDKESFDSLNVSDSSMSDYQEESTEYNSLF